MSSEQNGEEQSTPGDAEGGQPMGRRRGLTSLTLSWLAEKFRRAEQLKKQISEGNYQVDTQKVAKAVLGEPDPPR